MLRRNIATDNTRLPPRTLRSYSGKSRGRQPLQRARGGPSNVPATRRPFLRRCGAGTRIAAVWVAASARAAAPTEATAAIAAPPPRRRGKMATKRRGGLMCRTSRGESTDFGGALSRRGRKRRRLSSWKPTSVWYNARTPLQLALCVRSPSGIVVNTVVRAGSMASSQGDVVLTRRRLQHAGPCWSTTCPRCLWTLLTQLKLPRHIKASAADETLYVRVPPVYTPCIIHTRNDVASSPESKPCRSTTT